MDEKLSLNMQRQHTEHCLAALESLDPTGLYRANIAGARKLCITAAWLERREELIREVARLDNAAPELAALLKAIPELQIADVRRV